MAFHIDCVEEVITVEEADSNMLAFDGEQHIILLEEQSVGEESNATDQVDGIVNQGEAAGIPVEASSDKQEILKFNSFADFKSALAEYELQTIAKFVLRNQSKDFPSPVCIHDVVKNAKKSSDLPMIRWEFCAAKDFLPIPYMGIPYISLGKQVFQCHQGKDYNVQKKAQYELRKEILNHASRLQIKTRNKGPSKKLDCPVLFACRKMWFFPEYQLDVDSKRNRANTSEKIREKLLEIANEICHCPIKQGLHDVRLEMHEDGKYPGRLQYFTKFPLDLQHNHDAVKAAEFLKLQLKKHGPKGLQLMKHPPKSQVEASPYQYDKHVELIKALRATGDLEPLREAREKMASIYPLSEELWLEWFQDELPLAVIPEHKEFLMAKFEAAVNDYTSIKIWHEYCQFVMNNIESPSDIITARNVFERAITCVGLHITEGASIWDGYREFELAILDSYKQLQDSGDTVGMDVKVNVQIERIDAIFKRQLAVPLLGMSSTYQEYADWSSHPIPEEVTRAYERGSQKMQACMEFEEKLHAAPGGKLPEYLEYIEYEMKGGDPGRIQCMFERAIKDNPLHYDLWIKYTNYMDFKLKISAVALPVHERAVRNCPWVVQLWQNFLKALERSGATYERVKDVFEQALKGGFPGSSDFLQLWICYCDYHRRRITDWKLDNRKIDELHKTYEAAVNYMNQCFGLEGDKFSRLFAEWALVEAKYLQNLKRAQELWDTIMKKHVRDAAMWLDYIQLLMLFSDAGTVRRAYQRAVQASLDNPEPVCEAFVKFERQYGALEDVDNAEIKVEAQLQKYKERKEKAALKDLQATESKILKRKDIKRVKKKGAKSSDPNLKSSNVPHESADSEPTEKKRRLISEELDEQEDMSLIAPKSSEEMDTGEACLLPAADLSKSTHGISSMKAGAKPLDDLKTATDHSASPELSSSKHAPVATPAASTPSDLSATALLTAHLMSTARYLVEFDSNDAPCDGDEEKKHVTPELAVFLSNLLFSVQEKDIEEHFAKCGEIDTVEIVTSKAGKSKGYAYLQFKSQEAVAVALKMDRENLCGRPVFVSPCVDKRSHPTKFKFPTSLDKCTLYVTNLPFELTVEQLKDHFSQVGNVKQTRLVTNRSGKSKGFAYVEYETEVDAKAALVKFDQQLLGGRKVNVAISNPPARKPRAQKSDLIPTLGQQKHAEMETGRRRAKSQVSLVPRSVCKPPIPAVTSEKTSVESVDTSDDHSGSKQRGKSNADFRQMFLHN